VTRGSEKVTRVSAAWNGDAASSRFEKSEERFMLGVCSKSALLLVVLSLAFLSLFAFGIASSADPKRLSLSLSLLEPARWLPRRSSAWPKPMLLFILRAGAGGGTGDGDFFARSAAVTSWSPALMNKPPSAGSSLLFDNGTQPAASIAA
jgi:hypothetical protein